MQKINMEDAVGKKKDLIKRNIVVVDIAVIVLSGGRAKRSGTERRSYLI